MAAVGLQPGLCSVTFRSLAAERIIDLAAAARLRGIEWASDVHVLPGDVKTARRLAASCADRGLKTPSLGSYVRSVASPSSQEFAPVLDCCLALGANTIRVWAGIKGFAETSVEERMAIVETIRGYCDDASRHGVTVSIEYHPDTLTDHIAGAIWLLDQIGHDNCRTYWQPTPDQSVDDCLSDLALIGSRLSNLHVFYWVGNRIRRPLAEGSEYWRAVLSGLGNTAIVDRKLDATSDSGDRWAFMEFVREDDVEQFRRDSPVFVDQIVGAGCHQKTDTSVMPGNSST
ncbi:MAG: sugar phosphate isomerase/epimerase [Hyphomicrobiales bacterium]|nr:sugar phosphate isomerase/epimerase [Hyphomicrobiales bacterium]